MSKHWFALVLGLRIVALIPELQADTLTLRSNVEMNGEVQYDNDVFTIVARYNAGEKKVTFDRREVLSVEVNRRTFNPGQPPKDFSVLDARSSSMREASSDTRDHKKDSAVEKLGHQPHAPGYNRSVVDDNDMDRGTTDVVWLKDKSELRGRLIALRAGHLTIKRSGDNRPKDLDEKKIRTVLVAPE